VSTEPHALPSAPELASSAVERKLLIGIGNPLRGDDGVGWAVARHLSGMHHRPAGVGFEVRTLHGDAADLVEAFRGVDSVVIVDAARSESPAGTLHRLDATREGVPAVLEAASTHGLGLAVAVELARALGCLPRRLLIYGIEGADFSPGADLSPQARRTVFELVQHLTDNGIE